MKKRRIGWILPLMLCTFALPVCAQEEGEERSFAVHISGRNGSLLLDEQGVTAFQKNGE